MGLSPKSKKNGWTDLSRRNILVALCLLTALIFGSNWIYEYTYPPFAGLTEEHGGINWQYRQYKEPSSFDIEAGKNALKRWKTASRHDRHRLAGRLVASKVLIGMNQREIVDYMGVPDAFGAIHDIDPNIQQTGYDAADGESVCDLLIEIKNAGKASDAFLDVNY